MRKSHLVRPEELYPATRFMSKQHKRDLGMTVPVTVYVQDPLVAHNSPELGLKSLDPDWEPNLMDGPTSARLAIMDYDADSGRPTEPARWNPHEWRFVDPEGRAIGADNPTIPQFHQVNVWAVIQNILEFYENPRVLGRPIPWAFEGNRLIVLPRAGYHKNAFYDRRSGSLQFYYFRSAQDPVQDLVYTCLSHDIIAHETGHAVLDGIRPYYNELSSRQTAAFHEFVADLTAILSALRNNDVRRFVADLSDGDLSRGDVIADLAEKFGQDRARREHGAAARPYLRTANNPHTMDDIKDDWTAHACSEVLTGAMFEILTKMALHHMDGGETPRQALWHATDRFTRIALRPLDYCPPVDVQFLDYACALLHADELAYPVDSKGYRQIIKDIFHKRRLCKRSDQEHRQGQCDLEPRTRIEDVLGLQTDIMRFSRSRSRTAAYHFLHQNRQRLHIRPEQDIFVADLYETDKAVEARRRLPQEIVLQYVWREDVPLLGARFGRLQGQIAELLCGGTLVFDGRGNILCFFMKPGLEDPNFREQGERRKQRLLDYVASLVAADRISLSEEDGAMSVDFSAAPLVASQVDGALRLEAIPYLRHPDRGGEGEDG